jgi:hypothetical protein
MAIRLTAEPKRDPIDEPGRKHGDRVPEVIDPPDPRRHDPPGPDSPRRPEDVPPQEVREFLG